jgi:AcrR family transcriptional regulator
MASARRTPTHEAATENADADLNGAGRERVAEIQRTRILAAMVDVAVEHGAANATVAHVVARSGVSRRTFYELFDDREDCFLAAFDEGVRRIATAVGPAYEQPGSWRSKTRAALTALLQSLAADPAMGRLLVVESLAAGPGTRARRQNVLLRILPIVDRGRTEGKGAAKLVPDLTAEGIVGGVLSILQTRLAGRNSGSLVDLTGPLMGMIVLPYLGPAAARREIERPTPKRPAQAPVARCDPLRGLEMRLTYRTVRVLMAVAELGGGGPYPSNRAVGARAGISDQGQISKLLARLHSLGLIDNSNAGSARGEPNAWTLTARGWEIHGAIAGQTSASTRGSASQN